jgi:hypothetical protein
MWRIWTWRREHGTHVTVQISWGVTVGPSVVEAVIVTVFNRSGHPVRVTGAGVEMKTVASVGDDVSECRPPNTKQASADWRLRQMTEYRVETPEMGSG